MNIRNIGLASAALSLLSPAICAASAEQDALNACARAFASKLAPAGAPAPAFKVVYGGKGNPGSVTEFYARAYTFDLRANDRKSGIEIARATCSADNRGGVLTFSAIPL